MADEEEIDVLGLRSRLRDEFVFVNKQKQHLQKEYNSIESISDSLLRGLWISGQQWRYLVRLKGGSNFAYECVYTSSLLDSIQFKDGYALVGFKEVKYSNFLRELRENTEILKSIFILADKYTLNISAFVQTIVHSVYASCLFPADEISVLLIVKAIIRYHLVYSERPLNIYHDCNSFVELLDVILNTSLPCRAFLVMVCRQFVLDILLGSSYPWTIEENELLSVMDSREVRAKFGEPGALGTRDRINSHKIACWMNLAETVYLFLNKISNSLPCLPDLLKDIITHFYQCSLERGFNVEKARLMVMRFFFNQVLVPVLRQPQPRIIITEVVASGVAKFNLMKLASIIQTLVAIECGDNLSNLSSEATQFYENLDKTAFHTIVDGLVNQSDSELNISKQDSMPGISRTSVLISKTDLDSLVSLLYKIKYFQNSGLERNSEMSFDHIINYESLDHALSHVEDVPSVAEDLANMSISTQNFDIRHELQTAFSAFCATLNEEEIVVVISLGVNIIDCPGLLPEEKVLGLPTPKQRRKNKQTNVDDLVNDLSDSDVSGESSSDDKLLQDTEEVNIKLDNFDSTKDALGLGFRDSFVDSSSKQQMIHNYPPTNPFAASSFAPSIPTNNHDDPFSSVVVNRSSQVISGHNNPENGNDPFTNVVVRQTQSSNPLPFNVKEKHPSEIFSVSRPPSLVKSPPLSPTNQNLLIDLGNTDDAKGNESFNSNFSSDDSFISSESHGSSGSGTRFSSSASSSSGSGTRFSSSASSSSGNGTRFSSSASSSSGSGTRFSSSASSSSGSGTRFSSSASSSSESGISKGTIYHKGRKVSDHNRKSLKQNIQSVISSQQKRRLENARKKSRTNIKRSEQLNDHNNFMKTVSSAGNRMMSKQRGDEIMHKYDNIKKDRPRDIHATVTPATPVKVSRDEEDVFVDAKNKLRIILSNGSAPVFPVESFDISKKTNKTLMTFLKEELADAMLSDDSMMMARLHETISTFEKLPESRYRDVLNELKREYFSRKVYLSYLVRTHQSLIATRRFLEKFLERNDRDREVCRRHLMMQCVTLALVDQKDKIDAFASKFVRLPAADEKSYEMKIFVQGIKDEIRKTPLGKGSNVLQQEEIFDAVDRSIICRVYSSALYSFGEPDKSRDVVFHESVKSLCKSIGEDFTLLEIKEEFQNEAPWFSAQNELNCLPAYKTPKDKLKCIQRCCTIITSLLGMSSGDAVGADAFTPVLIYVVMHANPKGLLTTVDFINNYSNETLTGEQYYCWMQFCSAIQFIKILLEENKSLLAI
ncbi:GTPase-activating protein and VPS9 domain-containing protein 1-like [Xenia sp. Carnegie-2017]|uniref:GTPase-activating protein and VPS9 domain-containing protein 1-like n=1 Tax=Xenia sp. Carnegie-2017 TaxID=2897299 RepID=UPI001F03643F|nr:GTPase-activating protein and VPS9 domain-containing protein 1-like [Xenia sp. Carnegie-2017]